MRVSEEEAVTLGLIEKKGRKRKKKSTSGDYTNPAVFELIGVVPLVTMNVNLPSLNTWITMQWYERNRRFKSIKGYVIAAMSDWEARNGRKIKRQQFGFPVVFFGRTTRHKDMDNVIIKPIIDAFVHHGVLVDDDRFNVPVSPLAIPIEDSRSFIFLFPNAKPWMS
ncbi:MAG: hypothetical protein D6732_22515, partial [Methanobacteriota archaeon]